jgi:fructoselysine 6-kinase
MLLSIGDNCIDRYVAPIEAEHVGGNALNVAVNLALHGLPAAYAGWVGSDGYGERVLGALRSAGVNTECLRQLPGATGVTDIELHAGEPRFVNEVYGVSDLLAVTPELLAFARSRASWIHLSITGQAQRLFGALEALGVPISVDLGSIRERSVLPAYAPLLAVCQAAFISVGARLPDRAVAELLFEVRRLGAGSALATRAARGVAAVTNGHMVSVPSRVQGAVVDSLGAGDAFIAGFLARARDGSSLEDQLECGSEWAAAACAHVGAFPQG